MIASLVFMTAVCCAAPPADGGPDTQEHYDETIGPLVAGIESAKSLVIYQGPPRLRSVRDAVEKQLQDKQKINVKGFSFYKEVIAHDEADEKKLIALCSDKNTFGKYGGAKFCGGFHPDWCLEFKSGKETYRVLVCLGCHEARLYGRKHLLLYSDLNEETLKQLLGIINPLAKDRAGPASSK